MEVVEVSKIRPYEKNPRKNDDAVAAVAESIRQCGYIANIVVDENYTVLCGHTRLKALQQLGETTAEITVVSGLSEDQKKKFRLLDNKTAENAEWDLDLLFGELEGLDFDGFDFGFNIDTDLNGAYNELLNDEEYMSQRKREGKDTFEVSFAFPMSYNEIIKRWIKETGKDAIVEMLIKQEGGSGYGN